MSAKPVDLEKILEGVTSPELRATFARMAETMATMPEPVEDPPPRPAAPIIQLPLWPEPVRATPNSFLRSALFAAIQGKDRQYMKEQVLASLNDFSVGFTGLQLDQSDLDVWEQAVHLARSSPLGNVCCFRANAFLKAIGRSNGKQNYKWLNSSITRLVACAVIIRRGDKTFTGSLLSSCARDEQTGIYKLSLDPDTIKLYGAGDWTGLEWDQRQALKSKPLALWLHGFYSTHARPYPIKVETLRELSGSSKKQAKTDFTKALRRAFAELEAVAGIKGTIEGGLVAVERKPTAAQLHHLTKTSRKRRPRQS